MTEGSRTFERRWVALLAVVGAMAAVVGFGLSARARPRALALALPPRTPAGSVAPGPSVHVHVAGAVSRPGLYGLPARSRVDDAIRAAGGPRLDADLDAVNLAAFVRDGDKVLVPARGSPGSAAAGGDAGAARRPLNLNTAGEAELDALPGIGPALAQRIVAWRTEHGPFRTIRDLGRVPGIGPRKLSEIEGLVVV